MLDSERAQGFMKIQEMRSAFPPPNKKVSEQASELYLVLPSSNAADRPPVASELDEGRWSVVSSDKREAGGLKYDEAIEVMVELDSFDVNGLCIVADSAAERIKA